MTDPTMKLCPLLLLVGVAGLLSTIIFGNTDWAFWMFMVGTFGAALIALVADGGIRQ